MRYWIPALLTAVLIFFISHQPRLPEVPGGPPDWLMHFLEYGFFALTCAYAATCGFDGALRTPTRLSMAFAVATLYGVSDEWHQSLRGAQRDGSGLACRHARGGGDVGHLVVVVPYQSTVTESFSQP